MSTRTKSMFHNFAVLVLLFGMLSAAPVQAAANNPGLPTEQLPHSDGMLNLNAGNHAVALDSARSPGFVPPLAASDTWNELGANPLNDQVAAIAMIGTDVYVGGSFTDAGGVANADYIAKWNGTNWSSLGSGLDGVVTAMAVSGTNVYVGGLFTHAGGVAAKGIAKWDGTAWSVLGTASDGGEIRAVAASGTDVYIGGHIYTSATGANSIAKWDGTTWSALGTGTGLYGTVYAIDVNGTDVYAGGDFVNVGGDPNIDQIAKWDGTTWSALGSGVGSYVLAIAVNGTDVYAGGGFVDVGGDVNADYIAKWDGTVWSALGSGVKGVVYDIVINGTDMYAGGGFVDAGGVANADYIAKWNGTSWSAFGATPLNGWCFAISIRGSDVFVGGSFTDAGGYVNADYIAKFGAPPTFSDVPPYYWAWQYIERLYNAGITSGCEQSPLQYCPAITVARAQMAVFLLKGIHGSSYSPPSVGASTGFNDVPPGYWSASWIKQLAAERITNGCGNGNYCPDSAVTRAQMAIFLLKSKYGAVYTPPPATGTKFSDVSPSYWAAAWIEQLANEGITGGCGNNNYCPDSPVTRAQMAVFLVRTFELP